MRIADSVQVKSMLIYHQWLRELRAMKLVGQEVACSSVDERMSRFELPEHRLRIQLRHVRERSGSFLVTFALCVAHDNDTASSIELLAVVVSDDDVEWTLDATLVQEDVFSSLASFFHLARGRCARALSDADAQAAFRVIVLYCQDLLPFSHASDRPS